MTDKPRYEELEVYIGQLEQTVLKKSRAEAVNRVLFHIASDLNTSETLQDFYRSIHQHLSALMDMTNFYIAFYYREENSIEWAYWVDEAAPSIPGRIENAMENRSLTGDVITARQPMLLDERSLELMARKGRVRGVIPKVWLGVPLMLKGEVLGVMAVQSYTNKDLFSREDVEVLSFVSEQVAVSIERKKAQEKLQLAHQRLIQSEKLEAIGTLAGGIAHDFNNTLSVTLGNINLAQMMADDAQLKEHLADAEKSVLQAKELASRFIVFSKGGASIKTLTDCRALLQTTIESIRASKGIDTRLSLSGEMPMIEADQPRLKDALANIIINGAEAMDMKRPVKVAAGVDPDRKGLVRICVIDTGSGMDKPQLERIFEPYYSTKPMGKNRGTGLGMSIAWSTVKNHQGRIYIDSTPGKGTRVDVLLPVYQNDEGAQKDPDTGISDMGSLREQDTRPPLILFMDDDQMMREITGKILTRLGYDPVLTANGDEAVSRYKQLEAQGRNIEIAILDLEVRQGMDGRETNRQLKHENPGIKTIIASGYASDPVMEDYAQEGFSASLAKPFSMEDLKQALANLD